MLGLGRRAWHGRLSVRHAGRSGSPGPVESSGAPCIGRAWR